MIFWLVSIGLASNIMGAFSLVLAVDKDITFILKNLNRIVDDDWEITKQKMLNNKRQYLRIGISLLILGFFCEIMGNVLQ